MRVAIYARVSSEDQHCEMQLQELGEEAKRRGWEAVVYTEMESTRKKRPELERLLADAGRRKFDIVMCWKLDRFGRSVIELKANLDILERAGVRFLVPGQGLDTDQRSPTGRLLLNMLAAIAEFERDLIQDRVQCGLKTYRAAYAAGHVGTQRHSKSGKDLPIGRRRVVFDRKRAVALQSQGKSIREIARMLGVGVGTVHRALKG